MQNELNKTEQHKKAMIEALTKSLGNVTTACKTVGVGRTTHYMWIEEDEAYAQEVKDIKDIAIDFSESALMKKIQGGDTTAIIFHLKTIGKKRGYVERQEVQHDTPTKLVIEHVGNNQQDEGH